MEWHSEKEVDPICLLAIIVISPLEPDLLLHVYVAGHGSN